ncbi:MAG: serine protease [Bacilli bacterium]|nr:serine protease [Bacillota bacterium]NLM31709.1 trypsin-like peptidase domain-containing protein [Acholeplasmataceae bacterium]HOA77885.1 serine protease [Bacilli bacterium]HPZ27575.1 serine protease [Bacilli bacterium]HQC88881.1 serine protease [Bacilli bacterium]
MKKIIKLMLTFLFVSLLSACFLIDGLKNEVRIPADTLNYISTVVINSNVKIETETYKSVFGNEIPGPYHGTGSAVIIKKENNKHYIMTNYHVVYLADNYNHRYTVEDIYNNTARANVVFMDKDYDLAVLEFQSVQSLDAIELASKNPKVGDLVFSIGNPLGRNNIITAGKVLGYNKIENDKYKTEYDVIIHDAIIRSGSSGSMLINDQYKIVGLNTWGLGEKVINDYVNGGATPVEIIRECLAKNNFKLD